MERGDPAVGTFSCRNTRAVHLADEGGANECLTFVASAGRNVPRFCTFYPFLPGEYAASRCLPAQWPSVWSRGLLLIPWVSYAYYDLKASARKGIVRQKREVFTCAASIAASSIVAIAIALSAFISSVSLSFFSLSPMYCPPWRLNRIEALKKTSGELHPARFISFCTATDSILN